MKKNSAVQLAPSADNSIAFQHNHLIRTPLHMGRVEVRIFIHALGQIHQKDKTFKPIKIPVFDIVGKEPNGEDYESVHNSCKALVRQILNLLPPNSKRGDLVEVPLMAGIKLDVGTATVTGQFNELAKPYLLQLTEGGNYTSAGLEELLTIKNTNSVRLYWILRSYRNLEGKSGAVKKQIELDELKLWLLTDKSKYPLFAEFKRNVLDPIAKDFKLIGFKATWVPMRTGKKITALLFTIPKDEPKTKAIKAAAATGESSEWTAWLAAAEPKLQTAYNKLVSENKLKAATAQEVVKWIAGHPDQALAFYKALYDIGLIDKAQIKSMQRFTLARLNEALGVAFK